MREYLLCLFAAAAVTYLTTNVVRSGAIRFGAMAEVRDRDVHAIPIPRWGGLAMFAGLLGGLVLADQLPLLSNVFADAQTVWALLEACAIIVVIGMIDDRFGLDAATKLAGQVLAAGVMAVQGINLIWLPVGGVVALDQYSSMALTVFVVVLTINAVNFVDGLDGLAAGIVGIAAIAFFSYSYVLSVSQGFDRATLATLISALLVGVCAGFLPHNFFPARVFMGDTGSMLIGLLLAASTITLTGQVDPNAINNQNLVPALLPLLLPLAVVAIPLIDLLLAVVRRMRAGRSPFAPDKQHLHHRLLEMGHSQRRAAAIMYTWSAAVASAVLAYTFVTGLAYVVVLVLLVAVTAAVTLNIRDLRHRRRPATDPTVRPLEDAVATPVERTPVDHAPADADRPDADAAADATAEGIRVRNAALVRLGAVPVVAIGALLTIVWSLVDGWSGFLGALVGLVLVAAFCGSDIVLMRKTARMDPIAIFAIMAMAFTFKLTLLAVFLVVLKDTDAFSVGAFATTVIVLTSVGLAVAVWLSARTTTVVEPAAGENAEPGGSAGADA